MSAKDFTDFVIETRFANKSVHGSMLAHHPIIVHCDAGLAALYCAVEIGMDQSFYTHSKVSAVRCVKKLLPYLRNSVTQKQIKFMQLLLRNYINKYIN